MDDQGSAGAWKSCDGNDYFVRSWEAENPWARCLIVHGLGEHSGRYQSLAEYINQSGISVVAFDQQGHGKDRRPRGCIDSYDSLLHDISVVLNWTKSTTPNLPIVLLGHSMGGNLVLNHALRIGSNADARNCAAVISSSPMIHAQNAPGPVFEFIARIAMKIAPNFQLRSRVFPERLMSDPAEQEAWRQDEVFHTRLSLRLGAALIDTGRWALDNAERLKMPVLLTHGDDDALTKPEASQEFARRASEYCEFKLWQNYLHDPFRCVGKEAIVDHWVSYFKRQIEGAKL